MTLNILRIRLLGRVKTVRAVCILMILNILSGDAMAVSLTVLLTKYAVVTTSRQKSQDFESPRTNSMNSGGIKIRLDPTPGLLQCLRHAFALMVKARNVRSCGHRFEPSQNLFFGLY
ncbi:hypothetical protein EDC96DRAFT_550480 [Choanephora cucurbitarum]|nr:hypothetical protein EDC96DRAFT_550480 [Choanephora cucurbitarum]